MVAPIPSNETPRKEPQIGASKRTLSLPVKYLIDLCSDAVVPFVFPPESIGYQADPL